MLLIFPEFVRFAIPGLIRPSVHLPFSRSFVPVFPHSVHFPFTPLSPFRLCLDPSSTPLPVCSQPRRLQGDEEAGVGNVTPTVTSRIEGSFGAAAPRSSPLCFDILLSRFRRVSPVSRRERRYGVKGRERLRTDSPLRADGIWRRAKPVLSSRLDTFLLAVFVRHYWLY